MRSFECTILTTHVNLQGERFAVEGLESLAASYNENYLPLTREHDIRKAPIGRVKSASVEALDDGEFAVKGVIEMFEEGDTLSSAQGDGRKLLVATVDSPTFEIGYDSSYETPEGRELLAALKDLSTESGTTVQVKKSVEPLSVLTVAMYVGGAIAAGALAKLGEDLYDGLKNVLKNYFSSVKKSRERVVDFQFTTTRHGEEVEVHILLTNPTPEDLEALFACRFGDVDSFMSRCEGSDLARFVFTYLNGNLECLYVLRKDCVPLQVRRKPDRG